ncbi:hypothetical protein SUDANB1_05604 [Streptomyces sp. enrichment culture]|uniref:hypothetical protein n=1 Tax=Streptomyces sp. enrichment culture TaxID=1795815 RepID=UPI003F54E4B1
MTGARVLGLVLPLVCLVAGFVFCACCEAARRSRRRRSALLIYLRFNPDVSAQHLARSLVIPFTAVCAELDALERAGRVTRYRPMSGVHTYAAVLGEGEQ